MKKNIYLKIMFIFLPFLDVITAYVTRNYNLSLTPGIIIKSLILFFLIIYIIFSKSRYKKYSIYLLISITVYFILYFLFKYSVFNINYFFSELTFLFKLIYFPIMFCGLLCYIDDNNISNSYLIDIFKNTLVIYVILLLIPSIFNLSYNTYPADLKGSIGLFYAGNEIANIMIILFPFAYLFINKSKYSFLIIFPIIVVIMMIGTKVATFGCLIITILSLIFSFIKNKFKINKSVIKCLLVSIFALILSLNSYALYNYNYMKNNYYKDDSKEIVIDEVNKNEVNEIQNQLSTIYESNNFVKIIRPIISGRDILLANTISIYNNVKDDSNIWFGIGFSNTDRVNNSNIARLIEIDVCDLFFHFGIIGLLISFFPFIVLGYYLLKNYKKINIDIVYFLIILLLIFGISTLSGHVLFAPAVSIYLALILIIIINYLDLSESKNKLKNKISILSLHLGYGGIEKSIVDQANMLSEFYDVEIVSLYKLYSKIPYKLNKGVKVKFLSNLKPNRDDFMVCLHDKDVIGILKEGFKSIKILYLKYKLVSDYIYNCDSEIVISTRIDFTKLLSKYGNDNCIKIAEEHVYHNNSKRYIKKLKRSLKNINYLIPASKYLYDDYSKLFKNSSVDVKYIPQIVSDIPKVKNKCDNKNIIAVGRISKEKGYDDLIRVFSIVHKKDKDIKLTIVGDGDEKDNLINLVKEYKLDKYVCFKGFLNQEDLRKEYKKASLFVMTSWEESFGLVLLEAISYGIPCVAFDSALGAKEIIDKNSGILISNRNLDEMAYTICNYFEGKYKFNISNKIQYYSNDNVKNIWKKFIDEIIYKKSKKRCIFVSSQGGHLNELLKLDKVINNYNSLIVTEKCNVDLDYKVKFLLATTRYQLSYIYGVFYNIIKSLIIYLDFLPDVVISTGSHTAIPLCLIAHVLGKKVIYIESFANISSKSLAGKFIYPFADVFIVQWDEMLKLYPNAIYIGGLY